jgi:FMN phosphatase YigB (HAD superfamily)
MPPGAEQGIEAVSLDAMGVIYPVADDLRDLLIPHLRARGCTVPDEALIRAYRACYRDGAPARSIWDLAGCDWADGALERDFLACYQLNEGVIEFLEAMQAHSIPVYGLSNDVGEWATGRRKMLGIDDYFAGWVISSEVKAPKPEPRIYECLIEMLPCPPEACLFVDDRLANLEAARPAGLQAAWFGGDALAGFPSVAGFDALTALVLGGR